jgi:hypothetical protein
VHGLWEDGYFTPSGYEDTEAAKYKAVGGPRACLRRREASTELNRFFVRFALDSQQAGVAQTYVAVLGETVVGYDSLAVGIGRSLRRVGLRSAKARPPKSSAYGRAPNRTSRVAERRCNSPPPPSSNRT